MLYSILKSKLGSNTSAIEDTLTSAVFERLFYLPVELFWTILKNACYESLTDSNPKIQEFEFWAKWSADNTSNARYVEPDLFIRTADFDLIIEAKRWDEKLQELKQWQDQIQAYQNEYFEVDISSKKLLYIALGGLNHENTEQITVGTLTVDIVKCRWQGILTEVHKLLHKFLPLKGELSHVDAIINILTDIKEALNHHGYSYYPTITLAQTKFHLFRLRQTYNTNKLSQLKQI